MICFSCGEEETRERERERRDPCPIFFAPICERHRSDLIFMCEGRETWERKRERRERDARHSCPHVLRSILSEIPIDFSCGERKRWT